MGVTSYYSFGGEILGEETGGVRRDYLTDALGSVTATVTGAGVVENTYRYKPYGETLAKTGAASDPKFLWNGKWGYRNGSNTYYVRARHYRNLNAVWTSKDPFILFPWRYSYIYSNSSPIRYYDRSGYLPECCGKYLDKCGNLIQGDPSKDHCHWDLMPPIQMPGRPIPGLQIPGQWIELPYPVDGVGGMNERCDKNAKCDSITDSLEGQAINCNSMCSKMWSPPSIGLPGGYAPGDSWDMQTIVCQDDTGKCQYCGIFYCDTGKDREITPCLYTCLYRHEHRHKEQCVNNIYPPNVPDPNTWFECDAYRLSTLCMLRKAMKKNCPISNKLKQSISKCLGGKIK